MRTVRDEDGTHLLVLKESGESVLVREPESGEERYVPRDRLEPVDGESPLVTAARAVPEPRRNLLTAVPDERALGLLVELDDRGPTAVTTLLSTTDLCESDLHGLLGEFRAAGLVRETTLGGVRGYEVTPRASSALSRLRNGVDDRN